MRARQIPRLEALKKVEKSRVSDRPVFVVTFDPRLPRLSTILNKHWQTMVQDPHLKEVFPKPPLVSYRRQKNIRETLIRAKVPPRPKREQRKRHGMNKCKKVKCVPGRAFKLHSGGLTISSGA